MAWRSPGGAGMEVGRVTPGWWIDSGVAGPTAPGVDGADGSWAGVGTAAEVPGPTYVPGAGEGEAGDLGEGIGDGVAADVPEAAGEDSILERISAALPGDFASEMPVGGQDALSGFMMAMGVGVIVMVLLTRLRKRAKVRAAQAVGEPRERIEELQADAAKRAKAEGAIADVEEMARHFAAVLDDKAMRLEILIQQADERLGRGGIGAAGESSYDPMTPAANESEPERAGAVGSGSGGVVRTESSFRPAGAEDHGGVYALADEGLEPVAIAQKLGKPVGEVELILALRAS